MCYWVLAQGTQELDLQCSQQSYLPDSWEGLSLLGDGGLTSEQVMHTEGGERTSLLLYGQDQLQITEGRLELAKSLAFRLTGCQSCYTYQQDAVFHELSVTGSFVGITIHVRLHQ